MKMPLINFLQRMVISQLYATLCQHSGQICRIVIDGVLLKLYTLIASVVIHAEEIENTCSSNPSGIEVWAWISKPCINIARLV
jgi:hypothetical protein